MNNNVIELTARELALKVNQDKHGATNTSAFKPGQEPELSEIVHIKSRSKPRIEAQHYSMPPKETRNGESIQDGLADEELIRRTSQSDKPPRDAGSLDSLGCQEEDLQMDDE